MNPFKDGMDPFEFRKSATSADGTLLKMNRSRWGVVAGVSLILVAAGVSSGYPLYLNYAKVRNPQKYRLTASLLDELGMIL